MVGTISPIFCHGCFLIPIGFLLTTSPAVDLDYLNIGFEVKSGIEPYVHAAHPGDSALENIQRKWRIDGTTSWPIKSVHWLMVSLIIELEVTPHNDRTKKKVPDIQNAYLPIVRDLVSKSPLLTTVINYAQKRRRALRFKRHESVNLVRDYVTCMDEISQIHDISMQKIEFLRKLRDHYGICERDNDDSATYTRLYKDSDPLIQRIEGAMIQIEKDNENLPRLISDLKSSMDVVII